MSDRSRPLAGRWRELRQVGRAALIPYLPAGFPSPAASLEAVRAVAGAGADILEIGVPFSDPLADGPTIQRATQQALAQGMTLPRVLELVQQAAVAVPVVLMTYLNPVLAYGVERLLRDASAAGIAALLLTDLPAGAAADIEAPILASDLDLIRLVAPTTPQDRLPRALTGAGGFVYLISRLGVTGARPEAPAFTDLAAQVARIRRVSDLPIAVGFGLSTPEQAAAAAQVADGVVVGSALVDALGRGGPDAARELTVNLANAVRGAPPPPRQSVAA